MTTARKLAVSLALAAIGSPVAAETIGTLHHSFDVAVTRDGSVYDDESAIRETTAPAWSADSLGALPAAADLRALHFANDGRIDFSLDTFASLGGTPVGPEDVVAWNGASYTVVFDGSAAGIPPGAAVDAVAQAPGYGLLLSFDVTVPVGGGVADDEDVVAWNGSALSVVFDGSSFGVPGALDLDGIDFDASTEEFYLSFDGSGKLGGVDFDDDDLLRFDLSTWTKVSYAGLTEPGTDAADLEDVDYVTPGIFADDFETGDTIRWTL